jgi:hypothetical protein
MKIHPLTLSVVAALALTAAPAAFAQTPGAKKPVHAKVVKKAVPVKKAAAVVAPPAADADQVAAAKDVYYGNYDCEFKQTIVIAPSDKFPAYVNLKHEKAEYLMKPVVSPTGAIRLEDVRGETLMVQIAAKSMLLNVKTGHRLVDACVCPEQRKLVSEAEAAKATQAPILATAAPSVAE